MSRHCGFERLTRWTGRASLVQAVSPFLFAQRDEVVQSKARCEGACALRVWVGAQHFNHSEIASSHTLQEAVVEVVEAHQVREALEPTETRKKGNYTGSETPSILKGGNTHPPSAEKVKFYCGSGGLRAEALKLTP